MANPEHVAILDEGVEDWNQWRRENPKIMPDLSHADLSYYQMFDINFYNADLSHANLRRARLEEARLSSANLSSADMSEAKLLWADLQWTNLHSAKLIGANLIEAKFNGTNLSQADLTDAILRFTFMYDVDARGACFEDANLLHFRTAACDFTGAKCRRADFSDCHDDPKWQEFREGEFEKLYGPLFGVEVLLDPHVDFAVAAELMVWLKERWQATQPESDLTFEELGRRPQGYVGQFCIQRNLVEAVLDCFAAQLRALFDTQGRTQNEADVLVREHLEGLERRLARSTVSAIHLLRGRVGLTAVEDESRHTIIVQGDWVNGMKIESVKGKNVVIAENLLGTGIINMAEAAQDEAGVKAVLEQWAGQWEQQKQDERETTAQAIVQAISEDKRSVWKGALANWIGNVGGAATVSGFSAAVGLLKTHLGW